MHYLAFLVYVIIKIRMSKSLGILVSRSETIFSNWSQFIIKISIDVFVCWQKNLSTKKLFLG